MTKRNNSNCEDKNYKKKSAHEKHKNSNCHKTKKINSNIDKTLQ